MSNFRPIDSIFILVIAIDGERFIAQCRHLATAYGTTPESAAAACATRAVYTLMQLGNPEREMEERLQRRTFNELAEDEYIVRAHLERECGRALLVTDGNFSVLAWWCRP